MNPRHAAAAATLACLLAGPAAAQIPELPYVVDHSNSSLIDKATAVAIMKEGITERVWKVYSERQWGFISEVEGGFTPNKICVVAARVVMIPLTVTLKAPLMRPNKMATAFDALPDATEAQCKQLARDKLKEAVRGVVGALVKT